MKISCIRTYRLACKLEEPFSFSQWRCTTRHALLVQIVADTGAEGWGECYGPAAVNQAAVTSFYAQRLLGVDPMPIDVVWHQLWRASLDFARRGPMMAAMSGLDMALWDLKGRALGVPVCELFGGSYRDRLPCYASGMYFSDRRDSQLVGELVEEAIGYRRRGFAALKIKIGKTPSFDRQLIRMVRESLPDATLMADANHAYDLPEAQTIGRLLADENFAWFEEPLSPEHPELYRHLHDAVPVPLAAGECEQTRFGFQSLLGPGGVHIAQPDLSYCGGPSEALKIRALANSMGINVIPHVGGTMFSMAAAAHFLASDYRQPGRAEPAVGMLECDRGANPLRDEIFRVSLDFKNGHVTVPTRPGLGVEVDTDAMRKFCEKEEEVAAPDRSYGAISNQRVLN